jgi:hypothetical protein
MSQRKTAYKAGDEVDAWCPKAACKAVRLHTIIAMVEETIATVKCRSCGGEHRYKAPPTASETTAKKRRAEKKAASDRALSAAAAGGDYEALMKGRSSAQARPYAPSMALERHDLVAHPKFGLGLVTEIREGRKAQVAFPDGGRVLVFGR